MSGARSLTSRGAELLKLFREEVFGVEASGVLCCA